MHLPAHDDLGRERLRRYLMAIAWKEMAWTVFTMFPSLTPSIHAQHGVALAATLAVVVVGALAGHRRHRFSSSDDAQMHVRVAEGLSSRIAVTDADERFEALDDAAAEDDAAGRKRHSSR